MRVLPVALAFLVLLSGCLDGGRKDDAPAADTLPVAQRPVTAAPFTSYLHDVSAPIPGVILDNAIIEQYRTPVTELIELDTWIARPNIPGPVPLVLEVTPYYGGGDPTLNDALGGFGRVGEVLVARGFAVGISSVRGTGNSDGCFTQGGPDEAYDTAAVVEHLAGQEWSNGNVGIMGVSYPGTTPQDVWVVAPPALKAIVPISGISDLYKYNFVNGVPINIQGFGFNSYYWAMVGASPAGLSGGAQALDPAHVATAAAGEACTDQVDVQEGGVSSTVDGNKDAYWQVRDFAVEALAEPDVQRPAVFYIHGLQDWNVKPHNMEGWLDVLQASGAPYKVWLGQWGHAWPQGADCLFDEQADRGAACRNDWWESTLVAWFDQFLKGRDTGVLDGPRVQVQDDDGRWRHEQHWPAIDVQAQRLHFTQGKLGASDGKSSSYFDARGGLPTLPIDPGVLQAEWVSEPFSANTTLSGMPVFHGNVTASGQRASLILSLMEQTPDGLRRTFNFCAQSLNHVASLASGDMDIAGVRQEVEVRCFPQDDVVHKGSRLVVVASGNTVGSPGPGLQPIATGSTITIDHAGAWLDLPVDASTVYESPQPYDKPTAE